MLSVLKPLSYSFNARLKFPCASFNLLPPSPTSTPSFGITRATPMLCPAARRACSAADTLFPLASAKIRKARFADFGGGQREECVCGGTRPAGGGTQHASSTSDAKAGGGGAGGEKKVERSTGEFETSIKRIRQRF